MAFNILACCFITIWLLFVACTFKYREVSCDQERRNLHREAEHARQVSTMAGEKYAQNIWMDGVYNKNHFVLWRLNLVKLSLFNLQNFLKCFVDLLEVDDTICCNISCQTWSRLSGTEWQSRGLHSDFCCSLILCWAAAAAASYHVYQMQSSLVMNFQESLCSFTYISSVYNTRTFEDFYK